MTGEKYERPTDAELADLEYLCQSASAQTTNYLNNDEALVALARYFADGREVVNGLPQWRLGGGGSSDTLTTAAEIGHRSVLLIGRLIVEVRQLRQSLSEIRHVAEMPGKAWAAKVAMIKSLTRGMKLPQVDRTLTLANGVEVRAGKFYGYPDAPRRALEIDAIGRGTVLVFIWEAMSGRWQVEEMNTMAHETLEEEDLRPWSEVYPGRPVPGGEEGQ